MLVKYTTEPTLDDVLSVADLKTFCRVSGSSEDTLIASFRDAAIGYVEAACNVRIGDVTAEGYMDDFLPTRFPVGPVNSITSIHYRNESNVLTLLPTSNYFFEIDGSAGRIKFYNYPSLYSYAIFWGKGTFDVGYAEADVPEAMLQAVRILVAHFYERREAAVVGKTVTDVPYSVDALLSKFRVLWW